MAKRAIRIPARLWTRIERLARERGVDSEAVVGEILVAGLQEPAESARPRQRATRSARGWSLPPARPIPDELIVPGPRCPGAVSALLEDRR